MQPDDAMIGTAALIGALALAVPRVVEMWNRRAYAESVSAETVRAVFAEMRKRIAILEDKVGALEKERDVARQERDALASAHNALTDTLVATEGRVALLTGLLTASEDERAELMRSIGAGGGSDHHAPMPGATIDEVIANAVQKRRERSQ